MIKDLWTQAEASFCPGETPAALHMVEVTEDDFIEVEVNLVVGQGDFNVAQARRRSAHVPLARRRNRLHGRGHRARRRLPRPHDDTFEPCGTRFARAPGPTHG